MLKWNSRYATGHSSIDEDHREFIQTLGMLQVAIEADQDDSHIREMLTVLNNYVVGHFAREEAYMLRVRCPAYERNCRAHREFTEKFASWMRLIGTGATPKSIAADIHHETSAWIESHIMSVDCQLRACLPQRDH